jgi:hypothetical protein
MLWTNPNCSVVFSAAGVLPKAPPHPFECSCVRIQHDHSLIAVSIRYKEFTVVEERVGRLMQILCIRIPVALIPMAHLQQEFSSAREL